MAQGVEVAKPEPRTTASQGAWERARLVGVIGGTLGTDPFDRRTWSGSSRHFFGELQRRGRLDRALGAQVSRPLRMALQARHWHPQRSVRYRRMFLDPGYRRALTRRLAAALPPPQGRAFLQIGAYFDMPAVLPAGAACYGYFDGTLACRLAAPFPLEHMGRRLVARALAYERDLAQRLTKIFCMSDFIARSFVEDYGVPRERVVDIGGGFNLDAVPDLPAAKDYGSEEILFVGVDFARKGGWELLQAFARVRARRPAARLHLVGPRDLKVPPPLRRGVEPHGFLPAGSAELSNLFRRASLFAMPSLYEPYGIAPIEAMVHGLPAVVSDAFALRETVRHGVTGALVPPGDVEGLAACLEDLLARPQDLERMGRHARDWALRERSWTAVVDRLLADLGWEAREAA